MIPTPKTPELLVPAAPPSRLTAKVHSVEICWRVENSGWISVGPEPRLVLAVRGRRDVELRTLRVEFPDLGPGAGNNFHVAGTAESVLVQVPHVYGLRRLRPKYEPLVWGQEDVAAAAMFGAGAKPEDRAGEPEQIRWWGGTVNAVEWNVNASPNIWWALCGRYAVPKGLSLGVVVRCDVATRCRARMAGV